MRTMRDGLNMDRRGFLGLAAAVAAAPWARAAEAAAAPVLRLGSQEGKIPGANLREKVERLQSWGGTGLELGGNPAGRIQEVKEALQGTNVKVSALCWGAANGDLVATDPERRAKGIAALKSALDTAGELGSTGVIFVPCFHKQSDLPPEELRKILIEILPGLGDHAKSRGTRVLLEPLNRNETFYLQRLEQAASICDELNHPGVALMGDFYHMCIEESSDRAAFERAGRHLHHVHLASKARNLPGQDERSFVDGFRGLRAINFPGYCSLECGIRGQAMDEIPKSFDLLRRQWDEAATA